MMKLKKNTWFYPFLVMGLMAFYTSACEKDDENGPEVVDTVRVSEITEDSALCEIELYSASEQMSSLGVAYSSYEHPELGTPHTFTAEIATGLIEAGVFTVTLTGLEHNTPYHARAYVAYEDDRVEYGVIIPFTTPGLLEDHEGNQYRTVNIGTQRWMAENLRVRTYHDGQEIPGYHIYDPALEGGIEDAAQMEAAYGLLYTYAAIEHGQICPEGWRVPSDDDWTTLTDYIEAEHFDAGPGKLLKSERQEGHGYGPGDHPRWDAHEVHHGTNEYGFGALPAGYRYADGSFDKLGRFAMFWTSTPAEEDPSQVWRRQINHDHDGIGRFYNYKTHGFSIRCVSGTPDDNGDGGNGDNDNGDGDNGDDNGDGEE